MRSPKSVRRPHIRQQLTNRRKNLGRVAKSQRHQHRQWLLVAVLPNSINEKRQEAFASLELTEQPKQIEKVKKADKKKAQKQIAKDHEEEQKLNAKKAAEKEARRAEAEAKKRAAEEEEHKKWKAEQEKIQKEQEKKEAELKKLQAEKKKEKAAEAEKAKKAEKTKKSAPVVEEEVVVKKVAEQAAAPEPKTPTNTPAEPVEQVQEVTGKKNKKNKKKSESEAAPAPVVEQVVEQPAVVNEEPQQQAAAEKKNKKNKKKSESEAAAPAPVEPVVEVTPEVAPVTDVVEEKKNKKNKKDKKKSESEKVETVQAPVSQKPTADSMDFLDFVTAKKEEEPVAEAPAEVKPAQAEPAVEKIEEVAAPPAPAAQAAAPVSQKPTADSMDFLDFVTAKPEKSVEEPIAAPKVVEPVHAEDESTGGKKKNKKNKNKKNSESEQPAAQPEPVKEATPEVVEEVFEKKTVTPQTEAAAAPAPASKKNKKNKKGSGNSESHDVAAPAPTVEIPATTVQGGKGSPGSDKENSGAVNGSAKKQISVEELDYGVSQQTSTETGTDKKNKKKNKKGKNSNSISENAQVIAHLEQDHFDQMADDEVQAITGAAGSNSPPIQVHEVTSTEQHTNGQTIEKNTTIEVTQTLDQSNMSQTEFQKNVEKLVQATLAQHDIVEIDPTVKLRIDAQLIKLSEKKAPAVVMEHVNYIKPLPMELHISRPSTPSRDRVYKLLPKDIIFCAGLIDTHGENYAGMAADERNIFKDTSRALQRKIRIFKESPHYQTYLRAKEENRPIEEVIAAEAH